MQCSGDLPRVLCVDDEPNVLAALERTLFEQFEVETATSGAAGLAIIDDADEEPFSVIVSDMRMPEMDGAEFLCRARARCPETSRVLLTGQTELAAAIKAVNEGNIFRFLCKPCPPNVLVVALQDAVEQNRLVRVERELLDRTLKGAVKMLTEVLGLASPAAFSRAGQLQAYVVHMATKLGVADHWEFEIAAMLSQVGHIALPSETLDKLYAGQKLSAAEREMVEAAPDVGKRLLVNVPRLERVAAIVGAQRVCVGTADGDARVQLGVQLLNIAREVDALVSGGASLASAVQTLRRRKNIDTSLVDALASFRAAAPADVTRDVCVRELTAAMTLEQDVLTKTGSVILAKGRPLTAALIERLVNFSRGVGVEEPIRVRFAAKAVAAAAS